MAFISKVGNLLKQSASKNIGSTLSASNPSIFQAIRCMSTSKLFVGGLSYGTDQESLREAFSSYGQVIEARVIQDRETGNSRGFGFVTFTSADEASNAITGMDGKDLHGRVVRVNYANDRTSGFRSGGGGYGGYGGGGYGGGGYQGGGGSYQGGSGGGYQGDGGGYQGGGGYSGGGFSGGAAGGGYNTGGSFDGSGSGGGYAPADVNTNFASGGSDNFAAGGGSSGYATGGGYGGNTGAPFATDSQYTGDQVGYGQNGSTVPGGFDLDAPPEGNFKDADDEPGDLAGRSG